MTTVFLHDFLRIHIPVISKRFIFNNKVWKTHWFYLIIHKMVSFPLPKSEGQQKGVKNFAGVTEVSCSQEIEEKEIVF